MSIPPSPHLPLEPLLRRSGLATALTTTRGTGWAPTAEYQHMAPLKLLAELVGRSQRQMSRWRAEGVPLPAAEDACDRLGLHPCEVWGDAWIAAALEGGAAGRRVT